VSRLSFGMRAVQRAHARFVIDTEERRARLTGDEVDEDRIRRYSALLPPPPPPRREHRRRRPPACPRPPGSRGTVHRTRYGAAWATVSTGARTALSQAVRYGFRAAKFVVQAPLRRVRAAALDRRFVQAGLVTGPPSGTATTQHPGGRRALQEEAPGAPGWSTTRTNWPPSDRA